MRTGYAILVLAILLAAWRLQTPEPLPADAPATEFSATRAVSDIEAIAAKPHPLGTAEHDRVRNYLVNRLNVMGLEPQLMSDLSVSDFFPGRTVVAPVTNIMAVLKGKDPRKPALLVMSHYDTVPNSPGAADNSAGVATSLEIARALEAGPQPERDVVFLITDGEEQGLMGSTAFFGRDSLARDVGVVINFDARGDAGLAAMFETGPLNADTVAMYGAGARRPSANSLSRAIYKHMPNGSDFTLAVKRKLPGLNFAFIGDVSAYHAPISTPDHLDLGSVQHMGDQALAAARAFAERLPKQKSDSVYSDVLGLFFIQYSFAIGWVLLVLTAGLVIYAIRAALGVERPSWIRGIAGTLLIVVVPTLLLWLAGISLGVLDRFQRFPHLGIYFAGSAATAVGTIALMAALVSRPTSRPPALWHTMMLLLLLLAVAAQILLPEGAFVLVWPLLIAAAVAAVRFGVYRGANSLPATAAAVLGALIVLTQVAFTSDFLFSAVGTDFPAVLVLPLLTAVPLVLLLRDPKAVPLWVHGALVMAGVAVFAYGRFGPPSSEHPASTVVRYLKDLDSGKAYRIAAFDVLDPWARAALGSPTYSAPPWSDGVKYWWSPAKPVSVPLSSLAITRDGDKLRIAYATSPGAYLAVLSVRSSEALAASSFGGAKIPALKADERYDIQYFVPDPKGSVWVLDAPRKGHIEARLTTTYLNWPKDAGSLPPMPDNYMAYATSGGTQTVLHAAWKP